MVLSGNVRGNQKYQEIIAHSKAITLVFENANERLFKI